MGGCNHNPHSAGKAAHPEGQAGSGQQSREGINLDAVCRQNLGRRPGKTPGFDAGIIAYRRPPLILREGFPDIVRQPLGGLGYGIDIYNDGLLKLCAKTKKGTEADIVRLLNHRHPKDVIKAIHAAGGIAVLAHPACYWAINLDHFIKSLIDLGLDGIEVFYPYRRHRGIIKFHKASTVHAIAEKYNLIMTGGSDSHGQIESIKH